LKWKQKLNFIEKCPNFVLNVSKHSSVGLTKTFQKNQNNIQSD
jgi:hypothetical protein